VEGNLAAGHRQASGRSFQQAQLALAVCTPKATPTANLQATKGSWRSTLRVTFCARRPTLSGHLSILGRQIGLDCAGVSLEPMIDTREPAGQERERER